MVMRLTKKALFDLGRMAKAALTQGEVAPVSGEPLLLKEGIALVSVPTFHFNYRRESELFDQYYFEENTMRIRTELIEVARRSELPDPPLIQKVVVIVPPIAEDAAAGLDADLALCGFKNRYTDEGEGFPPLITNVEVEPVMSSNFRIRLTGLTALKQHLALINTDTTNGLGIMVEVASRGTFGFFLDEGALKFGLRAYDSEGGIYSIVDSVICDEFEDLEDYACEIIVSMVFEYDEADEHIMASSITVHQPSVDSVDPLSEVTFASDLVWFDPTFDVPIYASQIIKYSVDGLTSPAIGATTYGVETEYLPGYDGLGVPDIWRPIRTIDTQLIPEECAGKMVKGASVDPMTMVPALDTTDLGDAVLVEVGDYLYLDEQRNIISVLKAGG